MKFIYSLFILSLFAGSAFTQDTTLPKVFALGEQEKAYEQLNKTYSQTLLEASGNDIKLAFTYWLDMMEAMDKYAEKIKFDLKGIRLWIHVFWAEDGTIDHIGYLSSATDNNNVVFR